MTTPTLPALEPIRLFGVELAPQTYEGQAPLPVGFFRSFGLSWDTARMDVTQRWRSLFDESRPATLEELAEIEAKAGVGPMSFEPGITRQRAERLAAWRQREAYLAQFDTGLAGTLLGGIVPYVVDPVTLATLPVGGAAIARGVTAPTFGGFLRGTAIGGAQAGLASVPLEVALQQQARGEVDPTGVLQAAAAAVPASVVFSLPARLLARSGARAAGRTVDEALDPPPGAGATIAAAADSPAVPVENVHRALDADSSIPPPPVFQRTAEPSPTARLADEFAEYPGGAARWLQDFEAGVEAARAYLVQRWYDVDPAPVRMLIEEEKILTGLRSRRTADDLAELEAAVARVESGTATEGDLARVRSAGLSDAQGRLVPDLAEPEARAVIFRDGPEAWWVRKMAEANQASAEALDRLAAAQMALDAAKRSGDGKAIESAQAAFAAAEQARAAAEATVAALRDQAPKTLDGKTPPEKIVEAMAAAQALGGRNTPDPPPLREQPPLVSSEQLRRATEPLVEWARQVGVSEDVLRAVAKTVENFEQAVQACGVRA